MEALADAIRLRALGARAGVIDVFQIQVQRVLARLPIPAIFTAPVGGIRSKGTPWSSKKGSTRSFGMSAAVMKYAT
jgi:hypothetical protein